MHVSELNAHVLELVAKAYAFKEGLYFGFMGTHNHYPEANLFKSKQDWDDTGTRAICDGGKIYSRKILNRRIFNELPIWDESKFVEALRGATGGSELQLIRATTDQLFNMYYKTQRRHYEKSVH